MDPNETGNPSFETHGDHDGGAENDAASWRAGVGTDYQRVAEKFTSPADVVKSYAELERKLVSRVKLLKFGSRDVEELVVTYPIDFLPS